MINGDIIFELLKLAVQKEWEARSLCKREHSFDL